MKKWLKVVISLICVFLCICTISFFIANKSVKSDNYDEITDKISNINNNNKIENTEFLELWDTNVIGTLEIPRLNLKLSVADGIDDYVLDDYIGHFPSTPLFNGNVGMAGHNSSNFFATLKNIKKGDEIKYNFLLEEKIYIVEEIVEIREDDWSYLEDTEDNRLTIITCVKGKSELRLCVQAKEKIN